MSADPLEELINLLPDEVKDDDSDDDNDTDSDVDTDDDSDDKEKDLTPAAKKLQEQMAALEGRYSRLEEQSTADKYNFLTQIAQLQGALKGKAEPKEDPKETKEDISDNDLVEAMKQHPELAPQIMQKMVEKQVASLSGSIESRILGRLSSEKSGSKIEEILGHYSDDMKPGSPIYDQAVNMKDTLAPFLDPSIIGTNAHDRLAFLLAAANNPSVVAEKFTARNDALGKRREGMRDKLSLLMGGSESTGGGKNKGPAITEEEIEVGERMGMDLTSKEGRKKYLKYKSKSQGMGVLAAGEFLGRSK